MRSYENSGYNPFNENQRSESRGSARNYYSDEFDLTSGRTRTAHGSQNYGNRTGDFGSGRDSMASSGYGGTSSYGRGTSNYGDTDYNSRYGSSDYGSRHSGGWGSSGRTRDSWDNAGNRIENAWERTKDRVSNAWDRMTDDDDDNRRSSYRSYGSGYSSSPGSYRGSTYGSTGYGSTGSSYDRDRTGYGSTNYGTSNYGSGYSSGSRYSSDYDRDRDRGFFDRAGDEVRSWFGDEEAERRRRMDEMEDRRHDSDYNRYGSSSSYSGSTYSGPPYSYGSSSRRDYEW
ncbi:SWFGD domain-containing protein [Pontibacter vulgaris]|uniref:SWFGD domain-containing protein n=1 Tax=Pontibacter vulgaris TaxID=2905679 RepID=UPI001FA76A72|nr:SWFGD domain-containing protein [Pontibacter vulgaris]